MSDEGGGRYTCCGHRDDEGGQCITCGGEMNDHEPTCLAMEQIRREAKYPTTIHYVLVQMANGDVTSHRMNVISIDSKGATAMGESSILEGKGEESFVAFVRSCIKDIGRKCRQSSRFTVDVDGDAALVERMQASLSGKIETLGRVDVRVYSKDNGPHPTLKFKDTTPETRATPMDETA
jgi:hypothetical protein